MKKNLFLLLLSCCIAISCITPEQTTLTRFEGDEITGVDAGGAWEIKLTQGQTTKVVLTFPQRYEKQLVGGSCCIQASLSEKNTPKISEDEP